MHGGRLYVAELTCCYISNKMGGGRGGGQGLLSPYCLKTAITVNVPFHEGEGERKYVERRTKEATKQG